MKLFPAAIIGLIIAGIFLSGCTSGPLQPEPNSSTPDRNETLLQDIRTYNAILQSEPANTTALMKKGNALLSMDRYEEALGDFRPGDPD